MTKHNRILMLKDRVKRNPEKEEEIYDRFFSKMRITEKDVQIYGLNAELLYLQL